jgi:transcriptional regulator GlxA family with amidase domain
VPGPDKDRQLRPQAAQEAREQGAKLRSEAGRIVVAILAVPRLYALDVSIPAHVFGRHEGYRVLVCGAHDLVADIRPTHSLSDLEQADIVVIPGYADPHLPVPEDYLKALQIAVERGARVVAVCTGAFALAATGLLNGKTATTHWRHTDQLRTMYPEIDVVDNRLLVEDGAILTSAGASAGIDTCLHVVETDFGTTAADAVAREVVSSPARGATEPQYRDAFTPPRADLRSTREWALDNIASSVTVQRMADHSLLPRRTFIRRFARETGMPPMQWVTLQRILRARRLLEASDWSVERIAEGTGFGTAANFRNIFRREVGMTPTAYRKSHGPSGSAIPRTGRGRAGG